MREKLHGWLAATDPPISYKVIAQSLESLTGCRVSVSSLSDYFDRNYDKIFPAAREALAPKTITIAITVPAGCSISTEVREGESAA